MLVLELRIVIPLRDSDESTPGFIKNFSFTQTTGEASNRKVSKTSVLRVAIALAHFYLSTDAIPRPRKVSVIIDVTYFGPWGVLVIIDPFVNIDSTGKSNAVLSSR